MPIVDDNGAIHGLLGTYEDITERRRIEQSVVMASEREQQRLGQELHDTIGQKLTGIKFMAHGLFEHFMGRKDTDIQQVASRLEELASQCIYDARRIASGLFPHTIGHQEFSLSLSDLAKTISSLMNCTCTSSVSDVTHQLSDTMALHLYRIAQEAATNAIKHGKANTIEITLHGRGRHLVLEILDDGIGIAPEISHGNGMGLHIMQYRAELIGGCFEAKARLGGGTVVRCVAPCDSDSEGYEDDKCYKWFE